MKIIDFRYRPSTRASLDSVIKNPVYCEYIKKTDFCSRPEKSLPECIDELRGLDIAKAVVSGRDIESTYAIQSTNDDVLQCMAAAPDLFIGFWAYDPHKGMTAVRRFRKAVLEDGIRGAAIDAAMAHCAVDDAKFYPLYAMCCEFDIPVIMTAGLSPFMPKVVLDSTDPRHIDRVATDFPELKILLSHGGYPWVLEAIALVDARRDNSPGSGAISSSKSLLHICQQNYKKAKGEGNPSPFLFTVYSVSFSRSASTAVSLPRLIS